MLDATQHIYYECHRPFHTGAALTFGFPFLLAWPRCTPRGRPFPALQLELVAANAGSDVNNNKKRIVRNLQRDALGWPTYNSYKYWNVFVRRRVPASLGDTRGIATRVSKAGVSLQLMHEIDPTPPTHTHTEHAVVWCALLECTSASAV